MNIVNKVTLRHMKGNKRRTFVTILGVIISTAMITGVSALASSFMDLMQRNAIYYDGNWQVSFTNITKDQFTALLQEKEIENVSLEYIWGYANLEKSHNSDKPYVYIKALDENGRKNFNIHITEGRPPENDNELLISDHIASNGDVHFALGDHVTFDIGDRLIKSNGEVVKNEAGIPVMLQQSTAYIGSRNGEFEEYFVPKETKRYTIVGTFQRPNFEPVMAPGYTVITGLSSNDLVQNQSANVYFTMKQVNSGIFEYSKSLAEKLHIPQEQVVFNNGLLRWYGVFNDSEITKTLYGFTGILLFIIVSGSVALIYNAFAISVAERSSYLGMLASVGATRRQKRNSVFLEGIIVGIISIPLGILFGIIGIAVTLHLVNPLLVNALNLNLGFRFVLSPVLILLSAVLSAFTILISTYIPARRASKISAIDAIRQTKEIKLKGKNLKTSFLTRKIFGMEGELGLKNLKRNRGRYFAIVFSLAASIVLFLTISGFSLYLNKSIQLTTEGINFDVVVYSYKNTDNREKTLRKMEGAQYSTSHIFQNQKSMYALLTKQQAPDYLDESFLAEDGDSYLPYVYIYSMDDTSLKEYAEKIGTSFEELTDPSAPSCIVIKSIVFRDNQGKTFVEKETINAKKGDMLTITDKRTSNSSQQLQMNCFTKELPMGISANGVKGSLQIIVSEAVLEGIMDNFDSDVFTSIYFTSDQPEKLEEELRAIRDSVGLEYDITISNLESVLQQEKNLILLMSIFTYGFLALITAICVANIFNTISTSVALRRQEFAMLKSVGMTPESFQKMIRYESLFYGMKALLYGLPVGLFIIVLLYQSLSSNFAFPFVLPWVNIIIAVIAVFLIVGLTMLYAFEKIKDQNIIDGLKQDTM